MRLAYLILPISALAAAIQAPLEAPPLAQPPSQPQPNEAPLLSSDFEVFARGLLHEWHVPGMSVGVIKLGKEGQAPRVQFASVGTMGKGRPVDPDTLFGIASNSKAYTAASVGVLVDRGLFNWTDKVSSLIPEFALPDDIQGQPSVLDILSHRTGLPRHDHSYSPGTPFKTFVKRIKHLRPSAELREAWQYNNQMFMTAAYLVQSLTSMPFTTFVETAIFEPLNMTSSTFSPETPQNSLSHLSDSFFTLDNGTVVEIPFTFKESFEDLQVNAGAGGVVSSARDLMKWLEFLITTRDLAIHPNSTSQLGKKSPVSPASILKMSTAHMPQDARGAYPDISPTSYGLGLGLEHYQGYEIIRHGGSIPGFGTQVVWSSEHGVGAVALCNTAGSGNAVSDIATFRAFEDLLGLPHHDWNSRYKEKLKTAKATKDVDFQLFAAVLASPSESAPSLPLDAYLGLYHDEGYANATVCSLPLHSFDDPFLAPECAALYARLSGALPITTVPPPSARPSFLISRPGFFSYSHMLITQDVGNAFKGSYGFVFEPTAGGKKRTLGYDGVGDVDIKFIVEHEKVSGMEWSGVWGPGVIVADREKVEGRRVEVAFAKVE